MSKYDIAFLRDELRNILDFLGEVSSRYCLTNECDTCPLRDPSGGKCPFDCAVSNLVEARERIPDEEE